MDGERLRAEHVADAHRPNGPPGRSCQQDYRHGDGRGRRERARQQAAHRPEGRYRVEDAGDAHDLVLRVRERRDGARQQHGDKENDVSSLP